jgi:taurine dioxygenase
MIEGSVLRPLGIRVTDLNLTNLDLGSVGEVKQLLAQHGFVVFPEQALRDDEFVAFLRHFGTLTFSRGETPLPGFPDLNAVSNVGRKSTPRSVFHVDTSYVREPPTYTALRAVQIPAAGGQTLFTNQYRAYDTLSPELQTHLKGRLIRHVVTGLALGDDEERAADHPVFVCHPITGRTSLYVSTPERCVAISGLPAAESTELIALLYAHSTAPDNIYRHTWASGDVVMWDNGCVMHRADHSGVSGDRVLHRGMVAANGMSHP